MVWKEPYEVSGQCANCGFTLQLKGAWSPIDEIGDDKDSAWFRTEETLVGWLEALNTCPLCGQDMDLK